MALKTERFICVKCKTEQDHELRLKTMSGQGYYLSAKCLKCRTHTIGKGYKNSEIFKLLLEELRKKYGKNINYNN